VQAPGEAASGPTFANNRSRVSPRSFLASSPVHPGDELAGFLDFPASWCARGLHCVFPLLSREISVNQGPLRNFEKLLRGPPCKCVIRVSAATSKIR
jgi:hypothetical protein